MADFHPLLLRAIDSLPENTPEARRAIYERARSVLLSQLRSLDPPMSEADIARERLGLEDVIRRIEDDLADERRPAEPEPWTDDPGYPSESPADDGSVHRPEEPAPRIVPPPAPAASRRPRLDPRARAAGGGSNRKLILGGVLALIILGVAGLAYWANVVNRGDAPAPSVVAEQKPAQREPEGKIDERAGGAPAPAPSAPSQPAPPQPAQPGVPVSQRAILYEETPGSPQAPTALQGRVVWRVDSINPGQGLPLESVVRADLEIPEAGLTLALVIRRNTESTLPASHTIELTFGKTGEGEGRSIRDVGVPQLKAEEGTRGVPLAGLPVPVTENFFLVGLSNTPADIARNLEFLRNRQWIDIPIRYANGRRAVLAFEKGVSGDRAINDALKIWQQK